MKKLALLVPFLSIALSSGIASAQRGGGIPDHPYEKPTIPEPPTETLPTPPEAHVYTDDIADQPKWFETLESGGVLQGTHINMNKTASDSFGSKWWGGAYRANMQLWDWASNGTNVVLGGASLTAKAKVFTFVREVAALRVGVNGWTGDGVNGAIKVMGKTIFNFNEQVNLNFNVERSMDFFDETKGIDLLIFSVGVKATAAGKVALKGGVGLKNARASFDVEPLARVNVSAGASVGIPGASVGVTGELAPLVQFALPLDMFVQFYPNKAPCYDIDLSFEMHEPKGAIKVWGKLLWKKKSKTIARFRGEPRDPYPLIDDSKSCIVLPLPRPSFPQNTPLPRLP